MEPGRLRREVSKWRLAVARSASASDSAKLLWMGTAFTGAFLVLSVLCYQWVLHELSMLPEGVMRTGSFLDSALNIAGVVSLTALTVLGSLLAALLVTLLERIKWEASLIDRASYLAILAQNPYGEPPPVEEMFNMPIDIVVPRYRYALPAPPAAQVNRRRISVEVGGTHREWKKDLTFNDLEDSRAAQRIQAELDKLRFTNVLIRNDTDPPAPDRTGGCQILIGLRVNREVNLLLGAQTKSKALVAVEEIDGGGGFYSVALATTDRQGICEPPSHDRVHRDKARQLVLLIAKFCDTRSTQPVVGGLSDHGTLLAADAFSDRLLELARAVDGASRKPVGRNGFAAVFTSSGERFAVPTLQELRVP